MRAALTAAAAGLCAVFALTAPAAAGTRLPPDAGPYNIGQENGNALFIASPAPLGAGSFLYQDILGHARAITWQQSAVDCNGYNQGYLHTYNGLYLASTGQNNVLDLVVDTSSTGTVWVSYRNPDNSNYYLVNRHDSGGNCRYGWGLGSDNIQGDRWRSRVLIGSGYYTSLIWPHA